MPNGTGQLQAWRAETPDTCHKPHPNLAAHQVAVFWSVMAPVAATSIRAIPGPRSQHRPSAQLAASCRPCARHCSAVSRCVSSARALAWWHWLPNAITSCRCTKAAPTTTTTRRGCARSITTQRALLSGYGPGGTGLADRCHSRLRPTIDDCRAAPPAGSSPGCVAAGPHHQPALSLGA